VVGSEQERAQARAEWRTQKFTYQVLSRDDLEEIASSRLQPLRGTRLLEDVETGDFYVVRRDELIDLDFVTNAAAYYCAGDGTPVLLERPSSGVKTRAELEARRAELELRRAAPKPRRMGNR
jgi:hypothetical protein